MDLANKPSDFPGAYTAVDAGDAAGIAIATGAIRTASATRSTVRSRVCPRRPVPRA